MLPRDATPEEILERNRLQKEDALRYRNEAEKFEGRNLTNDEVMLWYIRMGFAQMFCLAWNGGQDPLNLYYTGLEVCHPPTRVEGYWHFQHWLDEVLPTHEISS